MEPERTKVVCSSDCRFVGRNNICTCGTISIDDSVCDSYEEAEEDE
jgi:hypothetical protein